MLILLQTSIVLSCFFVVFFTFFKARMVKLFAHCLLMFITLQYNKTWQVMRKNGGILTRNLGLSAIYGNCKNLSGGPSYAVQGQLDKKMVFCGHTRKPYCCQGQGQDTYLQAAAGFRGGEAPPSKSWHYRHCIQWFLLLFSAAN